MIEACYHQMPTMDPDKTYCAAAWRHVQLRTNRQYAPCCAWHLSHGFSDTADDPIKHPWLEALRQQMLSGVPHDGCKKCYLHEELIGESMRLDFNRQYGRVSDPRLDYAEINFGTLCNLVCRMCGPKHSSKWYAVARRMYPDESDDYLLERDISDMKINFDQLSRIKFIGGEPLMHQPKIRQILAGILTKRGSLSHLEVEIITNGTMMLDDDIVAMLQACKNVLLQISIDGLDYANAYQRHGSNWNETVDIAKRYDRLAVENWYTRISATVSVFTVHQCCDFHDWMTATLPNTRMITNLVIDPHELSPRNLPPSYKARLLDMLSRWESPAHHPNAARHRNLVAAFLIKEPNCSIAQVRHFISRLDGAMGTDMRMMLPPVWKAIFEDQP